MRQRTNRSEDVRARRRAGIRGALAVGFLLGLVSSVASAVVVNFPDSNLEPVIRGAIGKPTGNIYDTDLTGLTYLDAGHRDIVNLEGMQYCTGLTMLFLDDNLIVDISQLSGLTNVTYLHLGDNRIVSIAALAGLTNLRTLFLEHNEIVDIAPLSGLPKLAHLYASGNEIVAVTGLAGVTTLATLRLSNNQIVDISALAGLVNLTDLTLSRNQIVDISALAGMTKLANLAANNNQIVDISALSGLIGLTDLYLMYNQIVDVSPLAGLLELSWLLAYNNLIVDVSPLGGLFGLALLSLSTNQIVDVSSLSGLIHLTDLFLGDNRIRDIAPLVSNAGIDSGDDLSLGLNQLLLAPGSQDMLHIETLQARGVNVTFDPQNSPEDTPAVFRVEDGFVLADGTFSATAFEMGGADVAEWIKVSESVEPGDVLEFDTANPGHYRRSTAACSPLVAGVVTSIPGLVLGVSEQADAKACVALVGTVPVKVTNEGGPIRPGDLLVASSTPGHAMRWAGDGPCPCPLVGKALDPLAGETGVIHVLMTAH